jgi:uncharacterized membrane protein
MKRTVFILGSLLIVLSLLGVVDAGYLTWEHYSSVIPSCSIGGWFPDCGKVLTSRYALMFGIPVSLLGVIHYGVECIIFSVALLTRARWAKILAMVLGSAGFLMSVYFVYLMVFIIAALCKYCLLSSCISTLICIVVYAAYFNDAAGWRA